MSTTLEFDVQNVKCGGCASAIHEGLTALDGVDAVEVDIASGHVTVSGAAASDTAIRAKLTELGYPLKTTG